MVVVRQSDTRPWRLGSVITIGNVKIGKVDGSESIKTYLTCFLSCFFVSESLTEAEEEFATEI